jgi:hypothetical protein
MLRPWGADAWQIVPLKPRLASPADHDPRSVLENAASGAVVGGDGAAEAGAGAWERFDLALVLAESGTVPLDATGPSGIPFRRHPADAELCSSSERRGIISATVK